MSAPQQRSSSRPTTPHRLVNRSVVSAASPKIHHGIDGSVPLPEEQFIELADSVAVLDDNLIKINLINESIVKFNESFSSLLYGLLTNSYCTEFTEAPTSENFNKTYFDLDSQIRLAKKEINDFKNVQDAEKHKDEGNSIISRKEFPLPNKKTNVLKKPLTNATLSRLTNQQQRTSFLPHPRAKKPTKSSNNGDISYMTNDSFIEDPTSNNKGKRKHQFGTGGSSVPSSDNGSFSSRIPVRKPSAAPKPAWR